jgi:hypothetical protein
VVVIIGILLAVIVPRAWRANIDAKYGLVRQNATELASFASQWAESQMEAQDLASTAKLVAYYSSLAFNEAGPVGNGGSPYETWIADSTVSNWNNGVATRVGISGRYVGTAAAVTNVGVEATVEDLVPPERLPRNPFSGSNVFRDEPATSTFIPGALACGKSQDASADGNWAYYALVFQGTDSTSGDVADDASFHAGMGTQSLAGLRNGIFMARIQY